MGSLTLPIINDKLVVARFQAIFVIHDTSPGMRVY